MANTDVPPFPRKEQSLGRRIFVFLGSMDLAITLLLALAIASVIGTVLQQNQPYPDYLLKFGPFWFEFFETVGLYDVYSALWFLAILTLLVVSTSVCVVRHTPGMLRDMWNLRTHVQRKSLQAMKHQSEWLSTLDEAVAIKTLTSELNQQGFRTKITPKDDETLISAMRGGMNRLGYLFTHLAIVVICIGGLMDSNLPLKFAEWRGLLKVEIRDLPVSEVPNISRLAVGDQAFRGSIHIPEGRSSSVAFVGMRDGYLVQSLPFTIEVKDFRIEHYATGQPKSFETDLVIVDEGGGEPLIQTIAVNHPLIYKGYAIYQASFSDGGSGLSLNIWPLTTDAGKQLVTLETKVFEQNTMQWVGKTLRLEMTAFRPFNINPAPTDDEPGKVKNFGPSIEFKLRTETGEAREYQNYMLPVERDGRYYFLSGMRTSPAENFRYLYIPVDEAESVQGFMHFLEKLNDEELLATIAQQMVFETLENVEGNDEQLQQSLQQTLMKLVKMFTKGGFTEINQFIETSLPEGERETLGSAYLSMLHEILARVFMHDLSENLANHTADEQILFLQDAIDVIGALSNYGSPVYMELTDYEHVQASGLQVTKSPGKPIVYTGCAFLIMGVFLLFYLPQRRFWVLLKSVGQTTEILLAGMSNRNPREFDKLFLQMVASLQQLSGNSGKQ